MRDIYDGMENLLAHTAQAISAGLEDEYAQLLDVMYFPQQVNYQIIYATLNAGIFDYCSTGRQWSRDVHA